MAGMDKELDFSIPEPGKKSGSFSIKLPVLLMVLIIVISLINTVLLINGKAGTGITGGLKPQKEELKQLALKLEKQELNSQAVEAWKEYLAHGMPDRPEASRVWYRIGKIYQADGKYAEAIGAFYRSESFSAPDDIKNELGGKIQECLESAGKFAALRYELKERVGSGPDTGSTAAPGDEVVAEIGSHKITMADLDKKLEDFIETRIAGLSRYIPEDQIKKEKENLLKQYSTVNGRRAFLEQFIMEELLYRNARENRLSDDISVKQALKDMERSFLASKVLDKKYSDEIKITGTDVKNYYEANRGRYIKKEKDKEHQLGFEEVKDRAAMELLSEKETDVRRNFISQLMDKYNVVIHSSALSGSDKNEKE